MLAIACMFVCMFACRSSECSVDCRSARSSRSVQRPADLALGNHLQLLWSWTAPVLRARHPWIDILGSAPSGSAISAWLLSLTCSAPRRLAAWLSALLVLGHWRSALGARRSATLALSHHSAWPLVLGRLAFSTSQRGTWRSLAIVLARSSPWLLKPSASLSLALDLHPVTLSGLKKP